MYNQQIELAELPMLNAYQNMEKSQIIITGEPVPWQAVQNFLLLNYVEVLIRQAFHCLTTMLYWLPLDPTHVALNGAFRLLLLFAYGRQIVQHYFIFAFSHTSS